MVYYYSLQKILIEYIMLDEVNDEEQHAHQLGKLLDTFEVVNTQALLSSIGKISEILTLCDSSSTASVDLISAFILLLSVSP